MTTTRRHCKSASIRELGHTEAVLEWLKAGDEILISNRGKIIARLIPEKPKQATKIHKRVDWSKSAAAQRDKSDWPTLSAEEVAIILGRDPKRFVGA